MKTVVEFLKKILLIIELAFVIAFVHRDKVLFLGVVALALVVIAVCFIVYLGSE